MRSERQRGVKDGPEGFAWATGRIEVPLTAIRSDVRGAGFGEKDQVQACSV